MTVDALAFDPATPAPRASVVMPSFNQAAFLEEAVESVFGQGVDALELVVMDGGSTDGTVALLQALAARHPGRLRWYSGPDQGPASAIDAAVRAARGEVIGWLNSDDLFAPGAAARALAVFDAHPDTVLVYGHGEHVDAAGRFLEAYPTLGPDTPLARWADGCPVCQPTAWFRREAYLAVGGLDRSLKASFDYEFWLRLMTACPGRTRFVDALQARTRMHEDTITSRQRERVALEGVQVIHRHLGPAPAHWLLTHFGELSRTHPFDETAGRTLRERAAAVLERARPWLAPEAIARLEAWFREDARSAWSDAGFGMDVEGDGWLRPEAELRLVQPDSPDEAPVGRVVLQLEHAMPHGQTLHLRVDAPDGETLGWEMGPPGRFRVDLPVSDRRPGARLSWRLHASPAPRVADVFGGDDGRHLACRVRGVELLAS